MGMDVYGKNPSNGKGEYFRANVWSWRPIHSLIRVANVIADGELFDEKTLDSMGYNDGAGLKTQNECNTLAYVLENIITPARLKEIGFVVDDEEFSFPVDQPGELVTDGTGLLIRNSDVVLDDAKKVRSAYGTSLDHIKEFVEFLRHCGGFEVN
jgi:hypothetical protein